MVSQFFIHHLMLLFKGIKWSNRCWLWVHLWCKAALLPCTFWFLFSRGEHWCAVGALNAAIHYLNRHCAECKTLLVLTREIKFSCCDRSLFWQKMSAERRCLGGKSGAHGSCLGLLYLIVQCHQLHSFSGLLRQQLSELVQDFFLGPKCKCHNQYHTGKLSFPVAGRSHPNCLLGTVRSQ